MATFNSSFSDTIFFFTESYTPASNHRYISDTLSPTQSFSSHDSSIRFNDQIFFFTETWRINLKDGRVQDNLFISDVFKNNTPQKSFNDVFLLNDSFIASVKTRSFSDFVSLQNTYTAILMSKKINDTLFITDSFIARTSSRTINDSIFLTDHFAGHNESQQFSDSIFFNDSFFGINLFQRINQSIVITDSFTLKRPITNLALSDSLTIIDYLGIAIDDHLSLTEVWVSARSKSISNALAITQNFTPTKISQPISQLLSIHQGFCLAGTSSRGYSDALSISEIYTYSLNDTGDSPDPTTGDVGVYVKRVSHTLQVVDAWSGMPGGVNCDFE